MARLCPKHAKKKTCNKIICFCVEIMRWLFFSCEEMRQKFVLSDCHDFCCQNTSKTRNKVKNTKRFCFEKNNGKFVSLREKIGFFFFRKQEIHLSLYCITETMFFFVCSAFFECFGGGRGKEILRIYENNFFGEFSVREKPIYRIFVQKQCFWLFFSLFDIFGPQTFWEYIRTQFVRIFSQERN